ncbi:MAG: hypothetical protein ABFC78_10090, partial [Methanoregula sp.]
MNHNIKEIVVPVIIPDLKFFEIEREFSWIYTMIFHQPFFGKRLESFDPIDVYLTIGEFLTMIYSLMLE